MPAMLSDIISQLQKLQAEHGDIRCVTPGFDESDLDDVGTLEIVHIIPDARRPGIRGQHDEVEAETPGSEKAVKINF